MWDKMLKDRQSLVILEINKAINKVRLTCTHTDMNTQAQRDGEI